MLESPMPPRRLPLSLRADHRGRNAVCFGEAKNSWLTGTVDCAFISVSEGILGIKVDYKGLKIDPCIPKARKGFTASRKSRGMESQI